MSSNKVFVGNLNYNVTDEELSAEFSSCGVVTECKVIKDYSTGRSKGFAFVSFDSEEGFQKAIEKNDQMFMDRPLSVSKARERQG